MKTHYKTTLTWKILSNNFILIKANRTRSQGMEDINLSTCWQNQSSQVSRQQLAPTPSQSQLTTDKLVVKNKSRQHNDLLTFEYLIILTLYNKCIFENHLSGGACELAVSFPNNFEEGFLLSLVTSTSLETPFQFDAFFIIHPRDFLPLVISMSCVSLQWFLVPCGFFVTWLIYYGFQIF